YRERAGLYKLLKDVSGSRRLEKLYLFARNYPYGLRESVLESIGSKLREKYEILKAEAFLEGKRVKVDERFLRVAFMRRMSNLLPRLKLRSLSELKELYRRGLVYDMSVAEEIARVYLRFIGEEVDLGSRESALYVSLREASKFSLMRFSPQSLMQLLESGRIEDAYSAALNYAYSRCLADYIRKGYSEWDRVLRIQDKEEFVKSVVELSLVERKKVDPRAVFESEHLLDFLALWRSLRRIENLAKQGSCDVASVRSIRSELEYCLRIQERLIVEAKARGVDLKDIEDLVFYTRSKLSELRELELRLLGSKK
ncbi:MAG: hypothetical protein DRJ52_06370, partial [Thermoprotei archaeon]